MKRIQREALPLQAADAGTPKKRGLSLSLCLCGGFTGHMGDVSLDDGLYLLIQHSYIPFSTERKHATYDK